jgi:hypothetical protein
MYAFNTLLNKLQGHVFIWKIWTNFGEKSMLKFEFLKQFMPNIINFVFFSLIKSWSGLVVQTLIDVSINVSRRNVVYNHGKWGQKNIVDKTRRICIFFFPLYAMRKYNPWLHD